MSVAEHAHEALLYQVDDEIDDALLVEALAVVAEVATPSPVVVTTVSAMRVPVVPVIFMAVMPVPMTFVPMTFVPVTLVPVTLVPVPLVPMIFLFALERREATLDPAQLFENALENFAFHRASGSNDAAERRGALAAA